MEEEGGGGHNSVNGGEQGVRNYLKLAAIREMRLKVPACIAIATRSLE
jgi:hypothetical protein